MIIWYMIKKINRTIYYRNNRINNLNRSLQKLKLSQTTEYDLKSSIINEKSIEEMDNRNNYFINITMSKSPNPEANKLLKSGNVTIFN